MHGNVLESNNRPLSVLDSATPPLLATSRVSMGQRKETTQVVMSFGVDGGLASAIVSRNVSKSKLGLLHDIVLYAIL